MHPDMVRGLAGMVACVTTMIAPVFYPEQIAYLPLHRSHPSQSSMTTGLTVMGILIHLQTVLWQAAKNWIWETG